MKQDWWNDSGLRQRFFEKVEKGCHDDVCWGWSGSKSRRGYGKIWVAAMGFAVGAHRVSFAMHNDADPANLFVLHGCDNPECSNPLHLSLGTHTQNMKEMVERGRRPEIEVVLSEEDIPKIAEMYASGMSQESIAESYGLGSSYTVSRILNGKRWKGVVADLPKIRPRTKLSRSQAEQVRKLYAAGRKTQVEIARSFGVSRSVIIRIIKGYTHKDAGGPVFPESQHCRNRKLSDADMDVVASLAEEGCPASKIARRMGVSQPLISLILLGAQRKGSAACGMRSNHGHEPYRCRGSSSPNTNLVEADVLAIRLRYDSEKITMMDLAREYGIGGSAVRRILRGRTWKHVGGPIAGDDPQWWRRV